MSDNNHFIKTDWVCLGKKWGDLPMYVKRGIQIISKFLSLCATRFYLQKPYPSRKYSTLLCRVLPVNLTLYDEICTDKIDISSGGKEPAFPVDDDKCDGSNIPIDVIHLMVMSGGSVVDDRFAVDDAGRFVHTGVAEDIEQVEEGNDLDKLKDEVAQEELGRGRHVKQGSKRYGVDWEEH
jgi:hypothetical protein